jgi:hypothetical protein
MIMLAMFCGCRVAQVQRVQVDIALSDQRRQTEQLQILQAKLAATQDSYHTHANRLLNALQDSSIALQVSGQYCRQTDS